MILLIGAVGWGLLAIGAITHIWHHDRLRTLLAMHIDREALPAAVLTGLEALLAVAVPVALLVDGLPVRPFAFAALLLGIGFCAWIARLLLTGSALPCACSFSEAPTTIWSLVRAAVVLAIAALAFTQGSDAATTVATLLVGLAVAGALFVLPDALAWPPASRALLARGQAHNPNAAST